MLRTSSHPPNRLFLSFLKSFFDQKHTNTQEFTRSLAHTHPHAHVDDLSTLNYSVNYISLSLQHHQENIHCLRGIRVELNNAFADENLQSFAKFKA